MSTATIICLVLSAFYALTALRRRSERAQLEREVEDCEQALASAPGHASHRDYSAEVTP